MSTLVFGIRLAAVVTAALLPLAAHADAAFSHPALRGSPGADAGWAQARAAAPRFIGHPASPRWATVHANGEHPAVLVNARHETAIDPNTFIVQPPATAHWEMPQRDDLRVATTDAAR